MTAQPEMDALFSADYDSARAEFIRTATAAGWSLGKWELPGITGAKGEPLSIDTAFYPSASRRLLVVMSATHGVEGFAGSAVQIDLLRRRQNLGDVGVLLIHSVNPYGFSHWSRTNEDNVDLNRNLVDFAHPPQNALYEKLHERIIPVPAEALTVEQLQGAVEAFAGEVGPAAARAAITAGQYSRADGLFYGGAAPAWSRVAVERIAARLAPREWDRLLAIDVHTGLGPSGHGELIYAGERDDAGHAQARAWLPKERITCPAAGDSVSAPVTGCLGATFLAGEIPEKSFLAIEYGTLPELTVLNSLRGDAWLRSHGRSTHGRPPAEAARLRVQTRGAFSIDTPEWRAAVIARARQVIDDGIAAMMA